ncbi:MAG: hypothetical protein AVDCRST_MAG56-968 [uncultured Cytophagales bacterium]|uniref:Uncharacterized protein n=1 Tax=uncultured Cytophagales bacterium TaxID=158755 RepID=A0A6J4HJ09_9SPHI|nr:MAG: hypothetical protein AVDCRST_MAG56-968 [uncultured Cytophagales bacterium]
MRPGSRSVNQGDEYKITIQIVVKLKHSLYLVVTLFSPW